MCVKAVIIHINEGNFTKLTTYNLKTCNTVTIKNQESNCTKLDSREEGESMVVGYWVGDRVRFPLTSKLGLGSDDFSSFTTFRPFLSLTLNLPESLLFLTVKYLLSDTYLWLF